MGHREELMAAAVRCLAERGYGRTTSRDIAAAAGAPVGTINYHYGSKEALLNAALLQVVHGWGERTIGAASAGAESTADRLLRLWDGAVNSTVEERPMLVATLEALAQAEHSPEVRRQIADAYERGRPELAEALHGIRDGADDEAARAVGSVHMALIAGLNLQWLVDPDRAPSARQVATGLRAIAAALEDGEAGAGGTD
ncbi:TetR/AcrR family transcriptional regulator [Allonocardiopsis opalescens]|nr:TetR/AcrR family transcriptional regulator [Allonocardiopsis opalescens]